MNTGSHSPAGGSRLESAGLIAWLTFSGFFLALNSPALADFDHTHTDLEILLHRYVRKGQVDYRRLKREREILDSYVEMVSKVNRTEYHSWNRKQKTAFIINAYNAFALKQVIDKYPVKSINETGTLFIKALDRKLHRLFGRRLSLNQVRDEIIRKEFDDPRILFCLVPAARGAPMLRSEAYVPERIDAQLDIAARDFLRNPYKNRFEVQTRRVYLSEIFKWYVDDFSRPMGSVLKFIGQYLPREQREMLNLDPKELKVQFVRFDWSLNG